jgi:peptidylprolyl isomerase
MRIRLTVLTTALALAAFACESDRPNTETAPEPEPKLLPAATPTPPTPRLDVNRPPPPPAPKPIAAPEDVAAPPKDAKKTKTGLYTKVLQKGTGTKKPKAEDRVKVHYTGWTKDGKMFDSSIARGEPTMFGVDQVIKGWTEALQLMTAGEKRRLWIPPDLAYGESPRTGAPAGQLTFDVELVEILEAPKPISATRRCRSRPSAPRRPIRGCTTST